MPFWQVGYVLVVTVNAGVPWFASYSGLYRLAP